MRIKPSVKTKCPANAFAAPNERIIEFAFSNGDGGLIAFRTHDDGSSHVSVYRVDENVTIHTEPKVALRGKRK